VAIRFRPDALFLPLGLGLLAVAVYAYYAIVMRPATWPHVDALVVSSRVVTRPTGTYGRDMHSAELVLRLAAAHSPRDVATGSGWSSSSYRSIRSHVDKYPAGLRMKVAVNPDDRNDVRYDFGPTELNLIAPGIFVLLGITFSAIGVHAVRRGRAT
jgi:hypothetical protein